MTCFKYVQKGYKNFKVCVGFLLFCLVFNSLNESKTLDITMMQLTYEAKNFTSAVIYIQK